MKKTILFALLSAFLFTANTYAGNDIEKTAEKEAKKEAKRLKKEGWQVTPGSLPLERQLKDMFMKRYDLDELGMTKWYIGSSQPIGEFYDAARTQGNMMARLNLVEQIQSNLTAITEASVGNKQLTKDEAASVAQVIQRSKELVSSKLGRTVPLVECYRKLANGNYQLMIQIGYPSSRALEEAKEAVREQLEQELKELAEKFDKVKMQ